MFALSENFLKAFTKELRYQLIDLDNKEVISFIYYILFPLNINTNKGRRPFSIALKQYSPKCLELMLELLQLDQK